MKLSFILLSTVLFSACGPKSATGVNGTTATEMAQQIGDVMASVDEVGGTSGSIAQIERSYKKTFARLAPNEMNHNYFSKILVPEAQATSCSAGSGGFAGCSANSITRTFNNCMVGDGVVFSGTVVTTWNGIGATNCILTSVNNDYITRVPNFTVEGRRGATLSVTKSGATGQKMLWFAGSGASKVFTYTNDGINRKFTTSSNIVTFDHTTTVTAGISITGGTRAGRIMSGGTLHVKDNLSNITCDFAPSAVTWEATCNCPTSGVWQGACFDSNNVQTSTVKLVLNGCGTGNYTQDGNTDPVTFDRCGT